MGNLSIAGRKRKALPPPWPPLRQPYPPPSTRDGRLRRNRGHRTGQRVVTVPTSDAPLDRHLAYRSSPMANEWSNQKDRA